MTAVELTQEDARAIARILYVARQRYARETAEQAQAATERPVQHRDAEGG